MRPIQPAIWSLSPNVVQERLLDEAFNILGPNGACWKKSTGHRPYTKPSCTSLPRWEGHLLSQ